MTRVVVDASVAVKWFVPEIHSDAAERFLDPLYSLRAPDLIVAEVGNTLWKKVRRGELASDTAQKILSAFEKIDLELAPSAALVAPALGFATTFDRSVYDALYLSLAIAHDGVLVTADRKFHFAISNSALAPYIRWIEEDL
jgi:predicted nucleic acid-binding protein